MLRTFFSLLLCLTAARAQQPLLAVEGASSLVSDGQGNLVLVFPDKAEVRKYLAISHYDSCWVYGGRNIRADGLIRPTDAAMPVGQRLYLLDADSRKLVLLNTDLKLSGSVPLPDDGSGLPMPVSAFDAGQNGQFALLHSLTNRVALTDETGTVLREVGGLDYGNGRLMQPVSLCLDEKGGLYILDTEDNSLVAYDPFGQVRQRIALPGSGFVRVRMVAGHPVLVSRDRLLAFDPVTGKTESWQPAGPTGDWLDVAGFGNGLLLLTTTGVWKVE